MSDANEGHMDATLGREEPQSRLQVPRNDSNYVSIHDGKLIYILIAKRDDFDLIALPEIDHGENDRGHCLSKSLDQDGLYIVFQHWLKEMTIEAIREDNERKKAAATPRALEVCTSEV